MGHQIKKRKESVGHTNQCPFPSLYMRKCSVKSLSLGGRGKIKVYSKEINANSGAIKAEVTPKQNPLPVVLSNLENVLRERSQSQKTIYSMIHLCEMSRIAKPIETERRSVITGAKGMGEKWE